LKSIVKYTLAAWLIYILFWLWLISTYLDLTPTIIRVLSVVSFQMVVFYLNLFYFIPKFLDNHRKGTYIIIIITTLILATVSGGMIDLYLDEHYPFEFNTLHHRPMHSVFLARFFMMVMPIIISSLVSRSIQVRKQREESLELKNKMLEAETKALKAQINPHFLFNSLNNIYALSQMKSDKTPDAILHLSDILRYVTYDSNQNFVDLKDEIKTIESFILLQALKDDNQSNIKIEIDTSNGHYKIAPLLLIPFIENCFKHSNHDEKEKGWIDIKLKAADGKLYLICANSMPEKTITKDKTGGVGMENVQKRLALLYPDRHTLSIKYDQQTYTATLEINLEK
jgi:two-component system LytT family sensor kinase